MVSGSAADVNADVIRSILVAACSAPFVQGALCKRKDREFLHPDPAGRQRPPREEFQRFLVRCTGVLNPA
jgi:hypothetical protein